MIARRNPNGEIVMCLREEKGITQEQLAVKAGINRRTVQRLEKSLRISRHNITAVAEVLGVPTTSLYGPRGVSALVELAEEMTCRYCGAALTRSGSVDYQNVDVDYEEFACGAQNGLQFHPCPKDPRFPAFADYELEYFTEGDTVYCHARGKTEMARAVPLELASSRTQESAARFVERSFIAAKDGYEAAEAFYPWADHH